MKPENFSSITCSTRGGDLSVLNNRNLMMADSGPLVQATNDKGPVEPEAALAPPSTDDSTSSGIEATPRQASASLTEARSEKESAAKAALQEAARKLRKLAATNCYDIVQDIQDIDSAIAQLVGERGRKQTESAPPQPPQSPSPGPRRRRRPKRVRRRHRNVVE